MSIVNEGKLKDNKKSSRIDDDSRKSTIHWINSKDDDGCDSENSFKTTEGHYKLNPQPKIMN